jgi:hypothetical protein
MVPKLLDGAQRNGLVMVLRTPESASYLLASIPRERIQW